MVSGSMVSTSMLHVDEISDGRHVSSLGGRGSERIGDALAQCSGRSLEARAQPLDLSSTRPTDISRHEVQLACS